MADENHTCRGCGGTLVETKRLENGRKIFDCDTCRNNECMECSICHNPRTLWADSGLICIGCFFKAARGEIIFNDEQITAIAEWTVKIDVPIDLPET